MSAVNFDRTWLKCIGCGHETDLLKERKFRCPRCGSLYDVMHNFEPAGGKDLNAYTKKFDERAAQIAFHSDDPTIHSGVWRFKEWIMPFIPNEDIITLKEGIVPIVRAGKHLRNWIGAEMDLWLILEGITPTGSFKDFGGTVLMTVAKKAGVRAVTCASTGDTSAMAAAYAASAGLECAVILPRGHVTAAQLAQPLVHGAKVITLPGNFDDCMRVMQELVGLGAYPANSLNPSRIEGHQATIFQIAQFFGWNLPDWISVPVGNGSNVSSLGKAMRLMKKFGLKKTSRILGCQSRAASPLARSWNMTCPSGKNFLENWKRNFRPMKVGETTATAARIGDPVSRDKAMRELVYFDGAMQIAEEKNLNKAVAVCGLDGHFVCPQTGMALAGVREAAKKGWIKRGASVVVVSTAHGLKFTESATRDLRKNIVDAGDCRTETVAKILGL
ncbi:MAG: threonine synthase [Candidatus Niyogibacteria bacterium]|nr:threonine synthase [Candidatus Niyogibacteria bacterium]